MKKALSIMIIAGLLLFSVGCGPTEDVPEKDAAVSEETESESPEDADVSDDSAVVVKSSNAVSSEEKRAVLEELEKELDDALESINQLETVDDTDLVIE